MKCKKLRIVFLSAMCVALGGGCLAQESAELPDPFGFAENAKMASSAEGAGAFGLKGGAKGWWFSPRELDHLGSGEFWKGDLSETTLTGADPVPVIAEYAKDLELLGVRLILVPVPPKASIYPEKFSPVAMNADLPAKGVVYPQAGFLELLKGQGVEVIDLEPVFQDLRKAGPTKVYCAQDSHWSPQGAMEAASVVADKLREEPYVAARANSYGGPIVVAPEETIEIHGDLLSDEEKASEPKETLKIQYVKGAEGKIIKSDAESPVLVVADSHAQVFTIGGDEMHAQGAGFVDHLSAQLGFPVDVISSQGGGGDSARMTVARRAHSDETLWQQKKVVIWLFSAREFTRGKWRKIPANP